MKILLMALTIALLTTACTGGETSATSNSNKQTNISAEALKKMKTKDFESQVTLEIMQGKLKGTHVFKRNPEINAHLFSLSVKTGPGYKDDVTKRGTFQVLNINNEQSGYELKLFSKDFMGMIKQGNYPAHLINQDRASPLNIKNTNKNGSWIKADGEIQSNNDITFTEVGPWLDIKGKTEVRRVKGTFTDQVTFKYYDSQGLVDTETVTVKATFNTIQKYNPMFSNIER